jgi:hypothetical protein
MQEALQNPHFKKIWEEINWKVRHPEAKSLREALKFERKEPLSLLLAYSWPRERIFTSVEYDIRDWNHGMASVERVLGRPINLEDILILLTKHGKDKNEIGIILLENGNLCIKPQTGGMYDFKWEYSKPFYEQSPETWEKIANLI